MKKSIIMIILGIAGISMYLFCHLSGQSTIVKNYTIVPGTDVNGFTHLKTVTEHDWTVGAAGVVLGTIALTAGILSLANEIKSNKRQYHKKQESQNGI